MRVLVGDETGLYKSISLERNEQDVISDTTQKQTRARAIQRMCWYRDETTDANSHGSAVLARADGIVECYSARGPSKHKNSTPMHRTPDWSLTSPLVKTNPNASCVGLDMIKSYGSVVMGSSAGDIFVCNPLTADHPSHFNILPSDKLQQLQKADRLNGVIANSQRNNAHNVIYTTKVAPDSQNIVAVGGREVDLQLFSLETQENVFRAKNVKHDKLDMRVPVWIRDLSFLDDTKVVTATAHKQLRIYDSKAQRRPVQDYERVQEDAGPANVVRMSSDKTTFYVGDTKGNLEMYDLRKLELMGRFTGAVGSIRGIDLHPTLPYVASVGLDRMVRVYDINTRKEKFAVYGKQRVNSVLFCDDEEEEEEPERKKQKVEESEEEEEEEDYEGLEISEEENSGEEEENSEEDSDEEEEDSDSDEE